MRDRRNASNRLSQLEDVPAPLRPIHTRLISEGHAWREQLPFASSAVQRITHEASLQAQQQKGPQMEKQPGSQPSRSPSRRRVIFRRIYFSTIGILVLIVGVFVYNIAHPPPPYVDAPRPVFHWTLPNNAQNLIPQDAFAQGVTLTPCNGTAASKEEVSWIATNPDFGFALIQLQCPSGAWDMLFIMTKSQLRSWIPFYLYLGRRTASLPARDAATVPSWLALPPGSYGHVFTSSGGHPSVLLQGWDTTTQLFLGGTITASLTIPYPSTPVELAGHSGSMAQYQGLVVYLVPLSGQETFLFVGTGSPQLTQTLALAMLNHLDELSSL